MTSTKIISIEGNIGSGKSTIVEYLKHHQELKGMKERDAKLYSIWKESTGLENTEWENLKKKVQVG